ncbi:MAG: YbhB/YbcL family Raf kinase inhibitor-like protein [Candidatus Lustribacter sp.]
MLLILFGAAATAADAAFGLSADGLADNALLAQSAGCERDGGTNQAPTFSWNGPPAGTRSFALVGTDPDGGKGKGAIHVLIYNIPATATTLTGAQIAAHAYAAGALGAGVAGFRGPCPPAGDAPHHYIVTIYALGVATLPPNLDHDALMQAMAGHSLDATTTILRYSNASR